MLISYQILCITFGIIEGPQRLLWYAKGLIYWLHTKEFTIVERYPKLQNFNTLTMFIYSVMYLKMTTISKCCEEAKETFS